MASVLFAWCNFKMCKTKNKKEVKYNKMRKTIFLCERCLVFSLLSTCSLKHYANRPKHSLFAENIFVTSNIETGSTICKRVESKLKNTLILYSLITMYIHVFNFQNSSISGFYNISNEERRRRACLLSNSCWRHCQTPPRVSSWSISPW